MSNKDELKVNDEHSDGIRELDNDLPNWWLIIFYVTIVFSAIYMYYYHAGGGGVLPVQEYQAEQKKIEAEMAAAAPAPAVGSPISDEELSAAIAAPASIQSGKQNYDTKCIACHAPGGAGSVGPNLTDDFWIHGGKPQQIVNTILKGVPEKGMISWEALLSKKEVLELVAYIKSIRGTNPANPKAPQGVKEEM